VFGTSSLVFYPGVLRYDLQGDPHEVMRVMEGYTGAGLSTVFFDFINAGFLAKYIYRSVNNRSYPAIAFDLGFQMYYPSKLLEMNMAVGLKNIGFDLQKDKMPSELYIGVSREFLKKVLLVKLDAGSTGLGQTGSFFNEFFCSVGAEYDIQEMVILRTGFKISQGTFSPSIGFGSGLKWASSRNFRWTFDYAYIPRFNVDEINNHQIAIGIRLYTRQEVKDNILFFELYNRKANLAYLKGNMEEAVKFWEMSLKFSNSESVERKLRQTKVLLEERKKQKKN
jgi:hypothetical protein